MNQSLENFYMKKMLEQAETHPFMTDEIVEEEVPKYYIKIPIPFFSWDDEEREIRIGFDWYTLFTLGREKIKRKAWIWESKKYKGSKISFKRYSKLK